MTISEGQLTVQLELDEAVVRAVHVHSTRPPKLAALLPGRTVADLGALVPALFSVCRVAQQAAARSALGLPGSPRPDALGLEALEHHVWHFDVEWPRALGLAPDHQALRSTLTALRARQATAHTPLVKRLEAVVEGRPAPGSTDEAFLRRCRELDAGVQWEPPRLGTPTLADCAQGLREDDAYAARPTLAGGPLEVGALARVAQREVVRGWAAERGWGLETRARARALDALETVAAVEAERWPGVESLDEASGVRAALVEVARGPLVHRVVREGSRASRWASVAPTEWTFHSHGSLQSLRGQPCEGVLSRARMLVTLLDPCVACSVEAVHA